MEKKHQQKNTKYTPEMVWEMFAETDRKFQETDRKFQETDRKFQDTDRKFQETDRKLDKLGVLISGIGQNNGDVAEDYFFNRVSSTLTVGDVQYDQALRNIESRTKKLQGEYDIVLINSQRLLVIEVKYKLHPNDVTRFVERKLPKFRDLFPQYKDYKIYAAVAAMSLPDDSLQLALDSGLLVMTQTGDDIKIVNPDDLHNDNLKEW